MFYVLRGNQSASDGYEQLKIRYPKLQKTRYHNSWTDTISRCVRRATSRYIWILNSEVDYTEFKFDYYPASWNRDKIHVFGTQWSHWGNTYLINSKTFDEDTQYIKQIEHLPNINHVRDKKTKLRDYLFDLVYIDHGNSSDSLRQISERLPEVDIITIPYQDSYLATLRRWINSLPEYQFENEYYVWICSSICDYQDFDFTWISDPFQRDQLHVFSSILAKNKQKFGDTFLVDISVLKKEIREIENLENYSKKINYVSYISAKRLDHPRITHQYDSQVDAISNFAGSEWPYVEFVNTVGCLDAVNPIVPSVWTENNAPILIGTTGASQMLVPSIALEQIQDEVYDYPYIDQYSRYLKSQPIDIVYISNGEPVAEENYHHLVEIIQTRGLKNHVHWVKDIPGRVASQHAAANISNTDWYFLVNGKIRLNPEFDFEWQPDRLQQAKHYIFTATNPVNGLEYGHQAIVANNRRLTLSTTVRGLDFTMDSLHSVVEKNCGIAIYNTDEWTTWRTAFREAIKLRSNNDEISKERLETWCTVGNGVHGEWSIRGSLDAIEYYKQVNGELDQLMNTYDWAWLKQHYQSLYK
jgi:hypothetical protein